MAESKIAAAAGISVGGDSQAAKAVEVAMRNELLSGIVAGEDVELIKAKMMAARQDAKPMERR